MKKNARPSVRIGLCQINPTVGALGINTEKVKDFIQRAKTAGCDIAVFPELSITGYPPEDLLLKPEFISENIKAIKAAAESCNGIVAVVGFVNKKDGKLYNSAAIIKDGKLSCIYNKICLPNYGVFDEKRYFSGGTALSLMDLGGFRFSVGICEDFWQEKGIKTLMPKNGADLMIAINASPYYCGKRKERESLAKDIARQKNICVAYLNLVGGQDELVFDGQSFVVDRTGRLIARAKQFEEDLLIFDMDARKSKRSVHNNKHTNLYLLGRPESKDKPELPSKKEALPGKEEEIYSALCLGLRDYVYKNGFQKVAFGLSGGIDSALVAAIAADSLGKENVKAVFMPSRYTSGQSREDSAELAKSLGIDLAEIGIGDIFGSFLSALEPHFKGIAPNTAEENLQARIRGTLLMALSNKFGYLLLATGNKSEVSTGYATLYGDMAGGLSVIKDVPKTLVYELANYRNSISPVIPRSIIERAPTAELKDNQKDQDTLPPYELLDKIICEYVENDKSAGDIIKSGSDADTVKRTLKMIDSSEYKRRQSAPGIKITPKAFGKDRRIPITNKFSGF